MKTSIDSPFYGYRELYLLRRRYMTIGMSISVTIMLMLIGSYQATQWLQPVKVQIDKQPDTVITIINWQPPIDYRTTGFTPIIPSKLGKGIPVPVPEACVDPTIEFASQEQLSQEATEKFFELDNFGEGEKVIIPPDISDPNPDSFIPFEQEPRVIMTSKPDYPNLARLAGMPGNVTVKVLVDKEGKVKKAILLRASDEIFEQPALDAAKKWVFTPALMNGKPVQVWVSIPFTFRLTN